MFTKLINGDCLQEMKAIPDKSIDFILADPPYNTTVLKWDKAIPFNELWKELKRVIKENGAIALFSQQPFTSQVINSNLKNYKYNWIWKKNIINGFLNAHKQPLRAYEEISIFYKKQCLYNPQGLKPYNKMNYRSKGPETNHACGTSNFQEFTNYPINILDFPEDKIRLHPTQKPVKLLEYLIKTYTKEGETILDFCMGSGSTGEACQNTNRNFIGIEKDLDYYNISKKRLNA